jgi:hypothetical protein
MSSTSPFGSFGPSPRRRDIIGRASIAAARKREGPMPFLPSVKVDDKVPHVLPKFNTGTGRLLIEYHEALLRGGLPYTVAEREMRSASDSLY